MASLTCSSVCGSKTCVRPRRSPGSCSRWPWADSAPDDPSVATRSPRVAHRGLVDAGDAAWWTDPEAEIVAGVMEASMRDAVIVDAVRTPVGKRGRRARRRSPGGPVRARAARARRADRDRPGAGRRRHLGLRRPGGRADLRHRAAPLCSRPAGRSPCRASTDRPAVRVVAAGGAASPRPGLSPATTTSWSPAVSRACPGCRWALGRTVGGSPFGASGWIERYGEVLPEPGHRRRADRRSSGGCRRTQLDEFALASHEKAAARPGRRPVRRPARTGRRPADGTVRERRGRPPRRHAGDARRPATGVRARRRRHRRQRLADLRRRRRTADDHRRARPRAGPDADRPGRTRSPWSAPTRS